MTLIFVDFLSVVLSGEAVKLIAGVSSVPRRNAADMNSFYALTGAKSCGGSVRDCKFGTPGSPLAVRECETTPRALLGFSA